MTNDKCAKRGPKTPTYPEYRTQEAPLALLSHVNLVDLCPTSVSPLFHVNLVDLCPCFLLHFRDSDNQDAIIHPSCDSESINISLVVDLGRREFDATFKHANPSLTGGKTLNELFIARAIDYAGNVQLSFLGIPVYTDVFFDCAGQGDVDDVGLLGGEDIQGRHE